MMENDKNSLTHAGVLGMKWGIRKDRSSGSNKKIGSKKISRLEKNIEKVKAAKLSAYQQRQKRARRAKIVALTVAALYFVGPSIASYGVRLGKIKISNFMVKVADEARNQYGGFNPKSVVNSKMWDAPVVIAGLLNKG